MNREQNDSKAADVRNRTAIMEKNLVEHFRTARVTLIENFASHAAVQEFVDIKPD